MRPIDADRLLTDRMKEHYYHLPNGDIAIPIIDIEHAPTIEPKKGRWYERYSHEDGERDGVRCSECGTYYYLDGQLMNYCPNCGADMRGETDD